MTEWHTYTPDGLALLVRRDRDGWLVRCGSAEVASTSLEVALLDAIGAELGTNLYKLEHDYTAWVRTQVDAIRGQLANGEA